MHLSLEVTQPFKQLYDCEWGRQDVYNEYWKSSLLVEAYNHDAAGKAFLAINVA